MIPAREAETTGGQAVPPSADECSHDSEASEAEQRVLLRAVLRWLTCHQPGQVARIETALPHEALPRVWHVRAHLSSSARYHFVVFIPTAGAGICTRVHRL
jgi:hypothetical protein